MQKSYEEKVQELFRELDRAFPVDISKVDRKIIEDWLFENYGSQGMNMFFKIEDLKVLQGMGAGLPDKEYWIMVGRRWQLGLMRSEVSRIYNNRKSEEQKKKDIKARKRSDK